MMRKTLILVLILSMAVVPACFCQQVEEATAGAIVKNPEDWINRTVMLQGSIRNLQPALDVSTYELRDAESVITVRTESAPQREEFIDAVKVIGVVRYDDATAQPYIWEQSRGSVGNEVPTLLYVLIGSGGLLIILAIVLALMLTRKSSAEQKPVPVSEAGDGHLGDTVEVSAPSGLAAQTQEFGVAAALSQTQTFTGSLAVVDGPDAGKGAKPLTKTVTTIGRSPSKDIQLNDPTVSRDHAQVVMKDDGRIVLMNESRQGTLVNGQSVDSHTLSDGDRIQVGGTTLEAKIAGAAGGGRPAATAATQEFTGFGGQDAGHAGQDLGATTEFLGAELEVTSGPNEGAAFPITKSVTSVGRAPENDWTLDGDQSISRRHCEIHHDGGTFTLVSASDNGQGHKKVLLNGEEVVTATLAPGDEIRLGATTIEFKQI